MRDKLLESVANTIKTYREGELDAPTPEHVDRWLKQFSFANQLPFLREFDHVLKQTFILKEAIFQFLSHVIGNADLTNGDPKSYWKKTNLLQIQKYGQSQKEMLKLFDVSLAQQCKISLVECGGIDGDYIYFDDVIFNGMRAGDDLEAWVRTDAPVKGRLYVIVIAYHTFGQFKLERRLSSVCQEVGKKIQILYKCAGWQIENRKSQKSSSGVLWPKAIPETQDVKEFMELSTNYPFEPRQFYGSIINPFSSEEGRHILEQEFLIGGAKIRAGCENPSTSIRPLGFSPFGVGFGSLIITYRNCPNTCPLAIWWGDLEAGSPALEWYPLLSREGYSSAKNIFNDIADLTLDGT